MDEIDQCVAQLAGLLKQRQLMLATAESCTGGGGAQALTSIAGSSEWFERGFVTYSNRSKTEMLGVDPALIEQCGAVSIEVVEAMAYGVIEHSDAQVALAISGIAGPGGGSEAKPVGTVCFGWAEKIVIDKIRISSELIVFNGSRCEVRQQAVLHSLQGVIALFDSPSEA